MREVTKQLGVPQHHIKAIERGRLSEIDSLIMTRYVALLGIERWAKMWVAANPELAAKTPWAAAKELMSARHPHAEI